MEQNKDSRGKKEQRQKDRIGKEIVRGDDTCLGSDIVSVSINSVVGSDNDEVCERELQIATVIDSSECKNVLVTGINTPVPPLNSQDSCNESMPKKMRTEDA